MSERTRNELLVTIERRDVTIVELRRDKGKALLDLLASEEQAEALQAEVKRYKVAAGHVLEHFMPHFTSSRAVDNCLVELAAVYCGIEPPSGGPSGP